MKTITTLVALALMAGPLLAAPKKSNLELTPAEKAVVDRIKAENPAANPKLANNKFCPITGKLVDRNIPPLDCPQMIGHVHILVGVASKEVADQYAAVCDAFKSNKWAVPNAFVQAAANNMLVDLSVPKKLGVKLLVLPPDQVSPIPEPKHIAVDLTIDAGQKFQVIDGFGTCTYPYNKSTGETYAKPDFQKLIVEDLGLSMIRFEIVPAHFKSVEKPEQIKRQDFF